MIMITDLSLSPELIEDMSFDIEYSYTGFVVVNMQGVGEVEVVVCELDGIEQKFAFTINGKSILHVPVYGIFKLHKVSGEVEIISAVVFKHK